MDENGWIDRGALAKAIRGNPERISVLNDILREAIRLRYQDILFGKKGLILVDSALLVEFGSTALSNHHVAFVRADEESRTDRVIERYAKSGRTMSPEDVRTMFSLQSGLDAKRTDLDAKIREVNNGSSLMVENGKTPSDLRKTFFSVLNSVDISGELRTRLILKQLGLSDLESAASFAELRKIHEEPHRFYHTWEHIVELLAHLFEYATSENLTDEQIAVLGGAILFHDSIYEVNKTYYSDNEARSANLSRDWLQRKGVKRDQIDRIYTLIQGTAHGKAEPGNRDFLSALLHDFDLAIL